VIRYPIFHASPHGSDTYFTLELARAIAEDGRAGWMLSPLSYFGMYPLSYPGGTSFLYADIQLLSDANWNSLPWIISTYFGVFLILVGFMFFRLFHIRDEISVLMAGLMGISPYFLYLTFSQASGRAFILPLFVLALYLIFWDNRNRYTRLCLFVIFTFGAITIHRSSLIVFFAEAIAILVVSLVPILPAKLSKIRYPAYITYLIFGAMLLLWPYVPGLRDIINSVPEMSSTYSMAEWEFKTGFLLEGESVWILVVNLATNYIGSMGIILILLPLAFIALFPRFRHMREKDIFMLAMLIVLAPFIWKAQYVQLIFVPFAYAICGMTLHRWSYVVSAFRHLCRICRMPSLRTNVRFHAARPLLLTTLIISSSAFSLVLFDHRSIMPDSYTGERNWPKDSEVNIGLYLGDVDCDEFNAFVSYSGLVDRRIRWYSGLDSPVIDSVCLLATGYLEVDRDGFIFSANAEDDFIEFIISFYRSDKYYELNASIPNANLFRLSWGDVYGFLRLYFEDPSDAVLFPRISTNEAGIGIVVVSNSLDENIRNPFTWEGLMVSEFLDEVISGTYCIYSNDEYRSYLAASMKSV